MYIDLVILVFFHLDELAVDLKNVMWCDHDLY